MYALIRIVTSILALIVGWSTGFMGLVVLIWSGWLYLSRMELLASYIVPPPPLIPLLVVAAVLAGLLTVLSLVAYLLLPARAVMGLFVARNEAARIPPTSPVHEECALLARRLRMRAPALYVYPGTASNAWALSTLWGAVIAISVPLLNSLGVAERRWVLAHELAHIKYFDSGSAAYWISANCAVRVGWSLHRGLINFSTRVIASLGLPLPIWAIFCAPFFVVSYILITADAAARFLFRIVDRWVGRAMEYRADRVAARLVGPAAGVAALTKLAAGVEPSFSLFATHPATPRRLERLQRIQERSALHAARPAKLRQAAPATAPPPPRPAPAEAVPHADSAAPAEPRPVAAESASAPSCDASQGSGRFTAS